jgi:hypothetical protein
VGRKGLIVSHSSSDGSFGLHTSTALEYVLMKMAKANG